MLIIGFVMASLMLSPQLEQAFIDNVPGFNETCVGLMAGENCSKLTGYKAVYRLCLGIVAYHLVLCLLTACVKSSSYCRGGIHNGYWFWKILFFIGCIAGSFFMPNMFRLYWMYVGMIGGVIFIIFQLILLVDFCHSWNAKWVGTKAGRKKLLWVFRYADLCRYFLYGQRCRSFHVVLELHKLGGLPPQQDFHRR